MQSFNQSVIKHKTGLLNLAAELGNISKACGIMGFSRDTFYRYQATRDAGGVEALFDVSRRKPNLKNRVEEAVERAVVEFATDFPVSGKVSVSNELRKRGIFVSPSGVRAIWLRHNLANFRQRLTTLEKKSALKRKCGLWSVSGRMTKSASRLSRQPGHVLCGHYQGCRAYLPADLCGHAQ